MRYAKLSCKEFYSCYLQQCYSIATLIGLLAMFRRVIWIRSVRTSVQKFSWNWLFSFFWNWTWCYRPMWCCVFSVLYFFINLVYNESLYYCISCMLEQIPYLGKFWFLRYGPKCSGPIRLQDFSINSRALKLTVSHKKINEINWFLVCLSNSFLRDWVRKKR